MWNKLILAVFMASQVFVTSARGTDLTKKLKPEYRVFYYDEEINYYLNTINTINQKYNEGKIDGDTIEKQTYYCGDNHWGKDDPAIVKTLYHLLAKPAVEVTKHRMDTHTFSSWRVYHLPSLHNFTYCMDNGLLKK
ncbi:uncharacterized protein LOC109609421 [Aethina tumida]|uniref:uncharacterized protein LOC109609421 n=1 Tax=Aethina tumida TaxID=116153 RepID=UPI002148F766|nr:uncharacterized protein LOC109609421 [Aethina tumida]